MVGLQAGYFKMPDPLLSLLLEIFNWASNFQECWFYQRFASN